VSGTGAAGIDLNNLRVAKATNIGLGSTRNDLFSVEGSSTTTSQYGSFTLTSSSPSGSTNPFSIQDRAGTIQFGGPVSLSLGSGNDTLNLAADAANPTGFPGAVARFYGTATFNGGTGTNTHFQGMMGTNLFFAFPPVFSHFP
jgi:hypothetical protein